MQIKSSHTVRTSDRPDITSTYGRILLDDGSTIEARVDERGNGLETLIWYRRDRAEPWTLRVPIHSDLFVLGGISHLRISDAMINSFRTNGTVILV